MNKTTLFIYATIIVVLLIVGEIVLHWQNVEATVNYVEPEIVVIKLVDERYRVVEYEGELYWQSKAHSFMNGDYWIMGGKVK
jgi:hypothetical protein